MLASGKTYTAEGVGNKPLFAAHAPVPSTISAKVVSTVKQYQLVSLTSTSGEVEAAPANGISAPRIAVAAVAGEVNDTIPVFVSGCFNVDLIDVDSVPGASGKTGKAKEKLFAEVQSGTMQFVSMPVDFVVATV